jgi:hypothetical protein
MCGASNAHAFPAFALKGGKVALECIIDTPAASCTATSHNGIPGTRLCRQSRMHTRADAGGRTGGVRLVAGTVRLRVGAHGSGAPGQRRHQRAASAPRRREGVVSRAACGARGAGRPTALLLQYATAMPSASMQPVSVPASSSSWRAAGRAQGCGPVQKKDLEGCDSRLCDICLRVSPFRNWACCLT